VTLVGSTCTPADTLGRNVSAPKLREGDLVVIPNSGAYCPTTGLWGFNSQPLFSEVLLGSNGSAEHLVPQHQLLQYWS
jgi:diaminopimelate decarboxylase